MNEAVELFVLKFNDDASFYGSFHGHDALTNLEDSVTQAKRLVQDEVPVALGAGGLCLAPCGEDVWTRAEIRSLLTSSQRGTQAELLFIDRGTVVTLPLIRLLPLPLDLAQYPPLSQKFYLRGLMSSRPRGLGVTWSEAVMTLLRRMSRADRNAWLRVSVDIDPDNEVVIFCESGGTRLNFNECLVTAQLAYLVDTAEPAELVTTEISIQPSLPSLPLNSRLHHEQQQSTIEKFLPRSAPKYTQCGVYVESVEHIHPATTLGASGLPPSVCKELADRGFQDPTAVQMYAWPCISSGHSTLLISPPSTGKTLAYLLPLIMTLASAEHVSSPTTQEGPLLLILVATSSQARSVHLQVKKILSWISVAKTHRCMCSYVGAETEATYQLINGVDIITCTPPSLLRLLRSTTTTLCNMCHLVLDDGAQILAKFSSEMEEIESNYRSIANLQPLQVVVASSTWLQSLETVFSTLQESKIFTCSIEAALRAKVDMAVLPCKTEDVDSTFLRRLGQRIVVVCTSTSEEAIRLCQVLQLHSWPSVYVVKKDQMPKIPLQGSEPVTFVITDEVLPHVLEGSETVNNLLLYDLPSSKAMLKRRLALLYPALHIGMKCSVEILLYGNYEQQSPFVKKLLERSGKDVPQQLADVVERAFKEKEKRQRDYDLCYYLKAWGFCNFPQCSASHSVLTPTSSVNPKPVQVPRDGTVQVKVVHVSNATRMWVSLLQHSPLHRGSQPVPCADPSVRVKLSVDLANYYAQSVNRTLHENPCVGAYCGYQDEEGGYHRARVLKFSQPLGLYFHHKEQARVRLIDVGCVHIVDVNQLLTLSEPFLSIPAQVLEVFICRLRPLDNDQDWPEEAVNLTQQMLEGRVLDGNVALSCGETLWLDPIEQRVTLEGIGISTALTRPQQELIKAGLAASNPEHLTKLGQVLDGWQKQSSLAKKESIFASLRAGEEQVEVYVTAVASPELFFILPAKSESSLDAMETLLNAGQLAPMSTASLPEGTICAAKYPLDNKWYRAEVVCSKEHQSEVFFVDYGNTDLVANNLIQPIDPKLEQLPFQTIECSFNADNFEWSPEAGDVLWEWTRDVTFYAKVIDSYPSTKAGMFHYVVELYDSEGTRLARRLPRKSGIVEHVTKDDQDLLNVFVRECLLELSVAGSRHDQLQLAKRLQATVMRKPSLQVTGHDLRTMCELLPRVPDDVQVLLLRSIAGLASFQESICENLAESACLNPLLPVIKASSTGVLELCLLLIKIIVPQPSFHSLLSSVEWISSFAHCLRKRSSAKVVGHTVDILASLLSENRNLGVHLSDPEVIVPVCQLLCQSRGLHHTSCLTVLHSILLSHHRGSTVVKQLLPLGTVCALLDSEEPEVLRLTVEFLGKLCVDPAYKKQVVSQLLSTSIEMKKTSGVKCMLRSDLWTRLGLHHVKLPHKSTSSPLNMPVGHDDTDAVSVSSTQELCHSAAGSPPPLSTHNGQQVLHPKVLWSQSKSHVQLVIQLRGCRKKEVSLQPHSVVFRATQENQLYGFCITPFATIVPEGSSDKLSGSEVVLKLQKESCALWPRLTERKVKHPFLSVDFDHWTDSSSSESVTGKPSRLYSGLTHLNEDTTSSESEDQSDSDEAINDFMDLVI